MVARSGKSSHAPVANAKFCAVKNTEIGKKVPLRSAVTVGDTAMRTALPALFFTYCRYQKVAPPRLTANWSQQNPPASAGKYV